MTSPDRVLVVGDTHGDTVHIRRAMEECKRVGCEAIFVVGDFGFWEHTQEGIDFLDDIEAMVRKYKVTVYWLDGNHENHTLLRERYMGPWAVRTDQGFITIREGLFYAPRGHRWVWHGLKFLALGGAYSIDKEDRLRSEDKWRRKVAHYDENRWTLDGGLKKIADLLARGEHLSWWPEEEITPDEEALAILGGPVDVLLTHDKPRSSSPRWNRKTEPECLPNQDVIQRVVRATTPRLLIHGHLHCRYTDQIRCADDKWTQVEGLDCNPGAQGQDIPRAKDSWLVLDVRESAIRLSSSSGVSVV